MKPHRRFNLYTRSRLDFPTIRSGRVLDRLNRIGKPEEHLFWCALESGLIRATPKLSDIHIDFLASNREDLVESPTETEKSVLAAVRFDATTALETTNAEISWRLYRAGLLGLLAVAERKATGHAICDHIRSNHAAVPTSNFPDFPIVSDEQWRLFNEFAFYSKGRKSGYLTVELAAPSNSIHPYDFQSVFDQITAALSAEKLGTWQGDSGNDIEFKSKDLAAAQSCVEKLLEESFTGAFRFNILHD